MEVKVEVLVAQSYQTFCNVMDCSLPGFPAPGILQARTLEWVAISFSIANLRDMDILGRIILCLRGLSSTL